MEKINNVEKPDQSSSRKLGLFKGKYVFPDDFDEKFDEMDTEIASLFYADTDTAQEMTKGFSEEYKDDLERLAKDADNLHEISESENHK